MPRLNPRQRKQAIGRLNAGQRPQVVANAFNCNVRTMQRLRERHNATNSTNDRPRTGRSRVTTLRQDGYILRQHLQNRFLCVTHTARQTIGMNQRPISDIVRRRLESRNLSCRRLHFKERRWQDTDLEKREFLFSKTALRNYACLNLGSGREIQPGIPNKLILHAISLDFSLDLSPIQHLWDDIQRKLNDVHPSPTFYNFPKIDFFHAGDRYLT
ncbi:unnamed protein product [Mytilus edulis]|uniref:Transposase Tc1-like domain-containing protein n=1 Tax=Mytilus edulis TaxID=6550 RepID=A0A8S3UHH2_MYTED|nr:unnamed protein product [Mytilus edulis]